MTWQEFTTPRARAWYHSWPRCIVPPLENQHDVEASCSVAETLWNHTGCKSGW